MANEYDDYFNDSRQQALTSIVAPADEDDPEKAARAISLGQTTGVAPELIYPNVENFEKQHQAVLNSDLITKNARLQSYLNSDPMASKVSQDDVGHLDQVSELLHQFGYGDKPRDWLATIRSYTHPQNFGRGFWEGFGEQPVGQVARDYYDVSHDAFGSLGWHLATDVPEIGFRSISGLFHGLAEVAKTHVASTGKALGLDGETLSKDIAGMFEAEAMGMTGRHGMPAPEMIGLVRGAVDRATPYLEQGKMPPVGMHPLIDSVYKASAERDAKSFDEIVKESASNATRERSPDYFAKFADYQLPDGPKVRIDASAISRLYGDKPPEPDDGILGWIPNLAERLDTTAGSGGYIDVPMKDYTARIDPEIHKELRDDLLLRDHGFTVNEAKEVPDWKPETLEAPKEGETDTEPAQLPPTPVDPARTLSGPTQVVRGAGGLEPLFSVGDRKITLLRKGEKRPDGPNLRLGGDWKKTEFHDFDLLDQDGKPVGSLNLSEQKGGKQLYIEMIQAGADKRMYDPNFLGPALVRDIGRQLKSLFPNAFGPNGLGITGHRVSGAREKAGSWEAKSAMPVVKFDLGPEGWRDIEGFRDLLKESWERVKTAKDVEVNRGERTLDQQVLSDVIRKELERIIPSKIGDVQTPVSMRRDGTTNTVGGMYQRFTNDWPTIFAALDGVDNVGAARHEAIHHLRSYGFLNEKEWATLTKAAQDEGWLDKYDINKIYSELSDDKKLEEAVAQGYRFWAAGEKAKPEVHGIFEKIKQFIETIKTKFKELAGKDLDWQEIFKKVDTGEIGSREGKPIEEGPFDAESKFSEGDAPEPIKIGLPFGEGKAIGLRQDIYQRYMRLIRQKHEADLKADFGEAAAKEKRTQSKEWREASATIREQVESSIDERPNILVDRLLSERAGEFKIDPTSIREDLRETLPKEYMRKTNSHSADELAGYFGYPSGDAMVEHLAQITEDRKASGLSHGDYVKKLVSDEVNRQMEAQFGYLEKNILEEAKDRALSENQISIIEEEVLALAEQAKQGMPIERGAILSKLRESFSDTPVGGISSDLFLKASGKAGRETEEALLKGDYQEAFQAKQRQWLAVTQAKWAHAYEKQRKQLDKTAKRLGKRDIDTIEPEYLNHAQDLLRRVGYTGKRSLDNIRENIERRGDKTLQQFVQEKLDESGGYRDIPLAEFLQDPSFREDLDKLTHRQFGDLKATVDALVLHGRNEEKIFAEGEAADRKVVLGEMKGQLETFGKKDIPYGYEPGIGRQYIAGTTSIETLMNRWDRNDARGIFHKYVVYPLARASNGKSRLEREMSTPYRELGDPGNLKKLVASPLDPEIWKYSNFTRENVLGLIQNAGNKSNWNVAARGWGADPEVLFKWLVENSQPEDWQRAQKMGDTIFNKLIGMADNVYEHLNGHTIDKIPLTPLELEFPGDKKLTLKGWYHPLTADPMWRGKQKIKGGAYEDGDHNHIATSNGYARSRTGAIYPVDLGFSKIPKLMQQMIHDINFREPVLEVQKVFRDPKFQNDVTENYGKEYSDLLLPYLKNIAGQEAIPSKLWAQIGNVSEYLRQNTIGTYIGFNPYTVMKHAPTAAVMSVADVGPAKMLWAYKNLWRETSPDGRTWWDFAIHHSEELQRRDRNWQEATASVQREQYSRNNVIAAEQKFRDKVLQWGSWPVALSDKMSAVPLWVARFDKAMSEGSDFGEAVSIADRSVRRQHGSTAATNQPLLVQGGGPLHGWLTSVYGFFGTVMQRRLEIAHQLNDMYKLGREGEIKEAMKGTPELFKNFLAYVVVPTAIEEYVTGLSTEDREGYGSHLAKAAVRGLASSFLYFRDLAYAVTTSHDPSVGLLSSPMHDMANAARDVKKGREAINRQHAGKTVSDFITTFGELRGYAPKEVANIARFGLDYANKQAHPKEVTDWLRGLTRGTEKKRVEK